METEAKALYAELTKILAKLDAKLDAAMHTPGGIGTEAFNAIQDEIEIVGAKLEIASDAMSEARN